MNKSIVNKVEQLVERVSKPYQQTTGQVRHISREGIAFDLCNVALPPYYVPTGIIVNS
jgi:hypothetical protein